MGTAIATRNKGMQELEGEDTEGGVSSLGLGHEATAEVVLISGDEKSMFAESVESSVKQKESHQAESVWPSGRGKTQAYSKAKGAPRGHPRPGRPPHRHVQRRPTSWQPPRHRVP